MSTHSFMISSEIFYLPLVRTNCINCSSNGMSFGWDCVRMLSLNYSDEL